MLGWSIRDMLSRWRVALRASTRHFAMDWLTMRRPQGYLAPGVRATQRIAS
jgi:hypothetical protein